MSFNKPQRFHKKPFSQYELHTDRPSKIPSFMKSSEIISNCKENQDPLHYSNSSIIKEIQDIEKMYQGKIDSLKRLNAKLMSTIEFMEKTLECQKSMLQEKQSIVSIHFRIIQIMKQQNEISSYRSILSQNTQVNIKNLKTEIEDEKIKTDRLHYELKDFKYKIEKEKPLVHLFKKIEQTQEEYNQQNKIFMREVLQLLDKPRSQSFYRQPSKQPVKKSSFYN
ncbi:unnamed protein product (macronuclear) [Paramecium tetraurelia]|uniref:Uncharacterized protein n=1 Tax=Paramecium tetraurelia TaxID=5888 RepID=A0C9G3_PARTE|nr:uncharacterized protein GSPATT00006736001 [Paramecium tetraurelia]CAK67430.1 unnamed protein product [Paramecium tetraurelia]|eukprot:XP_001434827.1 hypothetical protein (macronuclear) [Paramecium tetraurelia strain d4-2]